MHVKNYYEPLAQPEQESEYHNRSMRVEEVHCRQELTREVGQSKKRKSVEEDNKKSPQNDAKKQRRKQARKEQALEKTREKEQQQQQREQQKQKYVEEKRQKRLRKRQERIEKEQKEKEKREVNSVLEQYCQCYKYRVELTLNAIIVGQYKQTITKICMSEWMTHNQKK